MAVVQKLILGLGTCLLVFLLLNLDGYNFSFHETSFGFIDEIKPIFTSESNKIARPLPVDLTSIPNELHTSVVFTGDVLLARNIESLMKNKDLDYPFSGLSFKDFSQKPYVFGNFEASVPEVHIPTKPLAMNFSVDKSMLTPAVRAGFTHFSLANNHSFDNKKEGFENTRIALNTNGILTLGHPRKISSESISYISLQESKVAIIAVSALNSEPTVSEIKSVLKSASRQSDFQIVYIHWGDEYASVSNNSQKELARLFIDAGADMIIGHHPHVVQEVGYYKNTLIFYSLGNYIFDQYFSEEVQTGLLLNLDFLDQAVISLVPVTSLDNLSQPTYMKEKKHSEFLSALALKSDPKLQDYIKAGVIPLNILVATSSKIAMMD
ncbi:CapA family protein [Candidatus Kaiserbacteria bacterium]|nr:CapA family protein [Candidatus Kaiserbacteria bacterium]USN92088.1 MAG: CapA family protein [Candidatus Nomurabacteria bacterium]